MIKKPLLILLIMLSACISSCVNNPSVAGGGLDTESSGGTLAGIAINSQNIPVCSTDVNLIPVDYTPFSNYQLRSVKTDSEGVFFFDSIDCGTYNVQALSPDSGDAFLYYGVTLNNDTVSLHTIPLAKTGSIMVYGTDSITGGRLYIPGTTIAAEVSPEHPTTLLGAVPAGLLPPLFYRSADSEVDQRLTDSLSVVSQNTTIIDSLLPWTVKRRIRIDTESLIGEENQLTGLPMLVRLNADNFDFSAVRSDGGDVRFYTPSGVPLAYEIELWDSQNSSAAIWVGLDTISLSSSEQFVWLYAGNSTYESISSSAAVFDTAAGFTGVWHLYGEKDGVKNTDIYRDATYHANHGDDNIYARGIDGVIGHGKQFDKQEEDYIDIVNIPAYHLGSSPFTLSFWFNKSDSGVADLFVHKNTPDTSGEWGISSDSNNVVSLYSIRQDTITDTICSSPPISSGQWHHICVSRSASGGMTMYVDGEMVHYTVYARDFLGISSGEGIFIGSNFNTATPNPYNSLNGYMDEVRLESVERSERWVRFQYLNQSGAGVVELQ
ncbi:MAG: DUF2341 domain-containing protein [Chitinivibrionales bacterium]